MSPKPKDLSDSEEEVPVEDGYFPFGQTLEMVNNEFNIPEPRIHLDENGQQILYHPVMYSVRTYREEIERIEGQPLRPGRTIRHFLKKGDGHSGKVRHYRKRHIVSLYKLA